MCVYIYLIIIPRIGLPLRKITGVVEKFGFCVAFSSTLD